MVVQFSQRERTGGVDRRTSQAGRTLGTVHERLKWHNSEDSGGFDAGALEPLAKWALGSAQEGIQDTSQVSGSSEGGFIRDAARQRGPSVRRRQGAPSHRRLSWYLYFLRELAGVGKQSGPAHWGSLSPLQGVLCGMFSLMM